MGWTHSSNLSWDQDQGTGYSYRRAIHAHAQLAMHGSAMT